MSASTAIITKPSPAVCDRRVNSRRVNSRRVGDRRVSRRRVGSRRVEMARVYRRRRITVAIVSALLVFAGVILGGAIAGSGGVPASASGAGEIFEPTVIVVRPGDTLWSIAHQYRGEISHSRYVDYLVRLNGGPSVEVGQQLRLP
jgi:hypothetical protein